ncbi:MAG: alpha/beta fold hydrolase [Chloroflexi bacterium]|nr:alpha/beta fold hydrolase [Chloroflexota bacterium]
MLSARFSVIVDGIKLVGELFYPPNMASSNPILCICHGIPAAVSDPNDRGYPLLAEEFAKEGFIVCIFNFRGCGLSEGNLDLLDWTRDLDGIITYLTQLDGVDQSRISLMGFSGGAATSAYVTAQDSRVTALVLCACPAQFSIGALNRKPEDFLVQCREVGTINDDDFPPSIEEWADHFRQVSPIDCIEKVSPRPLLIIHGDSDETIPPDHASQLFAFAREPRKLVMVPGGEHKLRTNQAAMDAALTWLRQVNNIADIT